MMMMPMTFWVGYQLQLLWGGWNIETKTQYFFSFLTVVVMAIVRRALLQFALQRSKAPVQGTPLSPLIGRKGGDAPASPAGSSKLFRVFELTAYHAFAVTLAYLLMLVAMTFNVGMFLVVIIGEGLGFALVDARERVSANRFAAQREDSGEIAADDCCA